MAEPSRLGARVRALRRQRKLSQVELAQKLGISPSYLNLIEHDQRPLTALLLLKLAQLYPVEVRSFAPEDEERRIADLSEVLGDALFEEHDVTTADLREVAGNAAVSRALVTLYRAYRDSLASLEALAANVSDGSEPLGLDPASLPSEEVSELLQQNQNHFPEIELAAERLGREAQLDRTSLTPGLLRYTKSVLGIEVVIASDSREKAIMRRYDPETRRLFVSEVLPRHAREFQIVHQIGLLTLGPEFESVLARARVTTPDSVSLVRIALASYFAGAVLMPYTSFLESARALRYDLELLGRRFGTSFEQVCHRLTTLRRPGAEGVPFHFVRVDIAGNISKRFSASGIRFARFSGLCPRWNVHSAFMTPDILRTQLSRMPNGTTYLCVSRTVRQSFGGFRAAHPLHAISLGCDVSHAGELVYGDGLDLSNTHAAVPIGITCRLCERMDCEQRAFPPIQRRLGLDENLRGSSFYTPAR
ncbi:MAG: short-chain fatty acyl-CoA regulator family protein [Acidobacteriota bacterium]